MSINWGRRTISSYSAGANNCVEVAVGELRSDPVVGVWDTKNRPAGHLVFPRAEWIDFLAAMSAGRSDR